MSARAVSVVADTARKPAASDALRINVYADFCEELQTLWSKLEPSSQHHVFQCYQWLFHWQRAVGSEVLHVLPHIVVVASSDGRPRVIFPLGIRRQLGARILEFLGGAQVDYQGPLIHDDWLSDPARVAQAWRLAETSLPRHDVRHFAKLPASWGERPNPMLSLWKHTFQMNAYSSSLPSSFSDFQARLRSKLRADNRRQRKRLSERGMLRFKVVVGSAEAERAIDRMIEQKRRRYRNTGVPDMFSQEAVRHFYRTLPIRLAGEGSIHLSVLSLNDEILATHWGAIHRGRYYFLIPTFADGQWSGYSPGRLLLENLVEWCIENGLQVFDFTLGGEEYKKDWCDCEVPHFEHLHVTTPRGLAYAVFWRCLTKVRGNERIWNLVKSVYGLIRYGRPSGR